MPQPPPKHIYFVAHFSTRLVVPVPITMRIVRTVLGLLCIALASSMQGARALSVSGSVTGTATWSTADSPVLLSGAVTVDAGVILTIDAGKKAVY